MKRFRLPESVGVERYSGVVPAANGLVLLDRIRVHQRPLSVAICPNRKVVQELAAALPVFLAFRTRADTAYRQPEIQYLLPLPDSADDEPLPERIREEWECDRMAALTALARRVDSGRSNSPAQADSRPPLLILCTPDGLFSAAPPLSALQASECHLHVGQSVAFNALRERLAGPMDYDCEAICERPGQFAVRGGLLDVYPLNASAPVRLDFFGDELESIRSFDPTTQRSLNPLTEITLAARRKTSEPCAETALFAYFGDATNWFFIEPSACVEAAQTRFSMYEKIRDQRSTLASLYASRAACDDHWFAIEELATDPLCFADKLPLHTLPIDSLEPYRPQPMEAPAGIDHLEAEIAARTAFVAQLADWQQNAQAHICAVLPTQGKADEVARMLVSMGFASLRMDQVEGSLPGGFLIRELPDGWLQWLATRPPGPLVVVSGREWLGRPLSRSSSSRKRLLPTRTRVDTLLDFADLADGDHLVHLSHGICRFRGLQKMQLRNREEEVISVEFADAITLHVPLSEAHLLSRYVGLTRIQPRLGKLGSGTWEKTRAAAERATLDYAAEMLQVQAKRALRGGVAFSPDTEWQEAFENAFPFTETPDQAEAIEATKRDMESAKVMDRLVCGDVGFGKTEVAIRAAFKAVMDGFQVAIMVPTTLLAQQHFETFRERFAAYPIRVEMLSRFRSAAHQNQILQGLSNGTLDVVVGTHRLISKDVRFARLGLLVIDEEHRFGVRHKDLIKRRRLEVDILSMSATPIPRTLYLALMGARDLSVIETPPADRLPIETIVRSYDPKLVESAIKRELDRGGQVFYLHNRVQTIDSVAAQLQQMLPDASIAVGHGQMNEDTLERMMLRFVSGKIDVLVCTTIIENGLDIPNCNTIIIEGADRFGLSQLYQLRGRVGRFKRQAYAYLLLHRHARILDQAHKRLSALRQHNQLGAGFRIAMRDLELRGAGNLLGHQQSGHIAGVGFDLYCQLLRHSIQRLKGDPAAAFIRANVNIDFIMTGSGDTSGRHRDSGLGAILDAELERVRLKPVRAQLPESYINEPQLRIDFYRQLAMCDHLDQLQSISDSLSDRFGKQPPTVKRLVAVTRIRILAQMAGIRCVETEGNRLKCQQAHAKRGEYLQLSGRFPRLTTMTPDLRLREIERYLTRLRHTPIS